jgi:hypothetical protein
MEEYLGCQNCAYLSVEGFKCDAYPTGIPFPILTGSLDHRKKLPSQKGDIVWKPRESATNANT